MGGAFDSSRARRPRALLVGASRPEDLANRDEAAAADDVQLLVRRPRVLLRERHAAVADDRREHHDDVGAPDLRFELARAPSPDVALVHLDGDAELSTELFEGPFQPVQTP